MKSIILVRHATAIVRDNDLPDFDRTLIRKGKKESRKMAERFLKYQITPGIWISSPAPRALETAYIFADILEFPRNKILLEDALYNEKLDISIPSITIDELSSGMVEISLAPSDLLALEWLISDDSEK